MAHPYRNAAHKNDPKWLDGVRKYADGGSVENDESESFTDEQKRRGNAAMNELPPSSYRLGDETLTQQRDRLGREAMEKLPPRSYRRKD